MISSVRIIPIVCVCIFDMRISSISLIKSWKNHNRTLDLVIKSLCGQWNKTDRSYLEEHRNRDVVGNFPSFQPPVFTQGAPNIILQGCHPAARVAETLESKRGVFFGRVIDRITKEIHLSKPLGPLGPQGPRLIHVYYRFQNRWHNPPKVGYMDPRLDIFGFVPSSCLNVSRARAQLPSVGSQEPSHPSSATAG